MNENMKKKGINYYQEQVQAAVRSGFNDISSDTDRRQVKIYEYILDNNLPFEFVEKVDYVKELATRTHTSYRFFQPRATDTQDSSGTSQIVNAYFDDFYVTGEKPQKRVAIAFRLEGFLFPALGNKRSRANQKGQEAGYEPNGMFIIDITKDCPDAEEAKKYIHQHGTNIAGMSNRNLDDDPEPETSEDLILKLKNTFDAIAAIDPSMMDWSTEEKVDWANIWISKNEERYSGNTYKSARSKWARAAFSDEIAQALEEPSLADIQKVWKSCWSREVFDPTNKESEVNYVYEKSGRDQTLERILSLEFHKRTIFTQARTDYALAIRAGHPSGADKTNKKNVEKEKKKILDHLQAWNSNENKIHCGMPRVVRVLLVKQLADGDEAAAYEWSTDGSKAWIKVLPSI